jgi:hypothetical protein
MWSLHVQSLVDSHFVTIRANSFQYDDSLVELNARREQVPHSEYCHDWEVLSLVYWTAQLRVWSHGGKEDSPIVQYEQSVFAAPARSCCREAKMPSLEVHISWRLQDRLASDFLVTTISKRLPTVLLLHKWIHALHMYTKNKTTSFGMKVFRKKLLQNSKESCTTEQISKRTS